jgi:hypothetical protein
VAVNSRTHCCSCSWLVCWFGCVSVFTFSSMFIQCACVCMCGEGNESVARTREREEANKSWVRVGCVVHLYQLPLVTRNKIQKKMVIIVAYTYTHFFFVFVLCVYSQRLVQRLVWFVTDPFLVRMLAILNYNMIFFASWVLIFFFHVETFFIFESERNSKSSWNEPLLNVGSLVKFHT